MKRDLTPQCSKRERCTFIWTRVKRPARKVKTSTGYVCMCAVYPLLSHKQTSHTKMTSNKKDKPKNTVFLCGQTEKQSYLEGFFQILQF